MVRKRNAITASLKVAILATWLAIYSLGPAGLHTFFECGHDETAETLAHQETDSAHWAGLKSVPASAGECPVCTIAAQAIYFAEPASQVLNSAPGEFLAIESELFQTADLWQIARPRAPPVS